MEPKFLIIGDKKEARFKAYEQILKNQGIYYYKITYDNIIQEKINIPYIEKEMCVKIFSPWYSEKTINYFQELGKKFDNKEYQISKKNPLFKNTPQTTEGFKQLLKIIDDYVNLHVEIPIYVNNPEEIYIGRNKKIMSEIFQKNDVPHPKTFTEINNVNELFKLYEREQYDKLLVKLHSGSLGKGIAIITKKGFYSTVYKQNNEFMSNGTIHRLNKDSNIEEILQFLIDMNSIVQEGIELGKINGLNFDIRHNVIHHRLALSDTRITSNELTNCSLGADYLRNEEILKYLTKKRFNESKEVALKGAKVFRSNDLGLDIAFNSNFKKLYCIEANFFPGLDIPQDMFLMKHEINKNLELLENAKTHNSHY